MAENRNKRGLGAGLGALLQVSEPETAESGEVRKLPIAKVEPRVTQPRTVFDEKALAELAGSISEYGVIQPLIVRRLPTGYYQIIAGERRWRAARAAGLKEIPAKIIEADDRLATELALVENLQREDLNPVEEAKGYKALIDEYGLTQEEASRRVGKSRPAVTNALRLLSLSPEVLKLVESGLLTSGHARTLAPLTDASVQLEAADTVISQGLSVRKTEALVKRLAKAPEKKDRCPGMSVDYLAEAGKKLEKSLGRKVRLSEHGRNGRIILEYYGADDREALLNALENLKLYNWK